MSKKKTVTVRLDQDMYYKIQQIDLPVSDVIRKSLHQFFRSKEPNHKIYYETDQQQNDVIQVLQHNIDDLRSEIDYLRDLHKNTMKKAFETAGAPVLIEDNNTRSRWHFWKRK